MAVAHTVNKKIEEIVSLKVPETGWLKEGADQLIIEFSYLWNI